MLVEVLEIYAFKTCVVMIDWLKGASNTFIGSKFYLYAFDSLKGALVFFEKVTKKD